MNEIPLGQIVEEHRMLVAIFGDKALRIKDEPFSFPIPNNQFDLKNLANIIEDLDPYSQEVVRNRFGLAGTEPKSIFQVAEELGLSPQRVLSVVNQALKRTHINTMTGEEARAFYFLQTLRGFKERVVMGNFLSDDDHRSDQEIGRLTQLSVDEINQIKERLIPRWNAFELSELD